jgi:hypothetical protein
MVQRCKGAKEEKRGRKGEREIGREISVIP